MGLEKHRGGGFACSLTFFSHRSPSLWTVNIFAADWLLIKDHTPSAGGLAREGGVDEVWKRRHFHLLVT